MNELPEDLTTRIVGIFGRARGHIQVTGIYLAERVFSITLSFITYMAFARAYGPTLVGTYSYAQTVMQFALPFLAAGSEAIVIRELVRRTRPHAEVMGSAFAVLSAVGLVATLVPLAFIAMLHQDDNLVWTLSLLIALGFIPNGFLVAEQALKAEVKAIPLVAARALSTTLSASARLFVILRGYPIEFVAAITAAEAFVLSGLLLYAYRRAGHSIWSWRYNASYSIFLLKQSLPAMAASVVVMLFFRANHILLVFMSGFETVGQYAVAFQVMQLFLVFPDVVFRAIYPRLVHVHATDPARYERMLNFCYFGFACLGYLIIAFNFLFAESLFRLAFGTRYDLAGHLIVILSVANLFDYQGAVRAQFINISNATHYHFINAAIGLVALLSLSLLLIPPYGAVGASWSIVIAFFISGVLSSLVIPATRSTGVAQIRALLLLPLIDLGRMLRVGNARKG